METAERAENWTLKQVQGDGGGVIGFGIRPNARPP
jgi:hypothetical protein